MIKYTVQLHDYVLIQLLIDILHIHKCVSFYEQSLNKANTFRERDKEKERDFVVSDRKHRRLIL